MKATVFVGIAVAIVGALLKSLTSVGSANELSILKAALVAVLATIAVIVAFARKTGVQSVLSVEDFWGRALIGLSTGLFGFEKFFGLFDTSGS